ncbi:MAG TPA: rRNA maturation RNase YbeY [Anaerolineae bacterium]|nr:rRNA maturation RNase YbeY [Anaerolineae bacterium]
MINLHLEHEALDAADAAFVVDGLEAAMRRLAVPEDTEVALVLTGDALLAQLNEQYRGKTGPTDVLSFPVDPEDRMPGEPAQLGDILISVPQAEANAAAAGHAPTLELRLLAVHGLLHLLGHEDETEAGAEAMRAEELRLGVREADDGG